jgi:uncharacterized protein Yka (UPF0111/DUF47 family)
MEEMVILDWMREDFAELAEEHAGTASNIHLAALGTEDGEEAAMSEEFAEAHRELARLYRMISENPLWLINKLNGGY